MEIMLSNKLFASPSVIRILLSTRPPMPHRVSANNDINVIDDISSNSLASNFEPAIRTIVNHLNRLIIVSMLLLLLMMIFIDEMWVFCSFFLYRKKKEFALD